MFSEAYLQQGKEMTDKKRERKQEEGALIGRKAKEGLSGIGWAGHLRSFEDRVVV